MKGKILILIVVVIVLFPLTSPYVHGGGQGEEQANSVIQSGPASSQAQTVDSADLEKSEPEDGILFEVIFFIGIMICVVLGLVPFPSVRRTGW